MEKKNLYILIIVLAIVGVGGGLGIYYLIQGLNIPPAPEQEILTIYGPGTTGNYSMTMTELQSTKYVQVTNQEFITKNYLDEIVSNGNYSGVSLRSILEEENLLGLYAENFTGIGLDNYNPGILHGMLNISDVMNSDYALCIIAYGGPDFDLEEDVPLKLMIDQSILDISIRASRYCVRMLASIYIAEKDILTIYGSGVINTFGMTMTELQSTKYVQVTNQEFYTRNFEGFTVSNGNYSGVSLRSILEEEGLLGPGAENYTGIGLDDYNPGANWGMLNISDVMNNDYNQCIIAFDGPDFDPLGDAPLKLMINQSIVLPTIRASRYCVKNLASILIE